MIKCENLTKADTDRIGKQIAEAFMAEEGSFRVLGMEGAVSMFRLITEICYEAGHLYTTGEKQEGFMVYWTKAQRPGPALQLKMGLAMLRRVPLKGLLRLSANQKKWTPTEKRYKKSPDFVEIFLIALRPEYQGQGLFKKMLAEPFALARQRGTLCVLDTDSELKAHKYCHEGMHIAESRRQNDKLSMYALER